MICRWSRARPTAYQPVRIRNPPIRSQPDQSFSGVLFFENLSNCHRGINNSKFSGASRPIYPLKTANFQALRAKWLYFGRFAPKFLRGLIFWIFSPYFWIRGNVMGGFLILSGWYWTGQDRIARFLRHVWCDIFLCFGMPSIQYQNSEISKHP